MQKHNHNTSSAQEQTEPAPEHRGWFKAIRNPDMPDLICKFRTAFIVAYMLAYRGRWNNDAFNPYELELGEAVCDYPNWGLSEGEFRNGRDRLKAWGFATFRATSRGTIGKLIDTRLFSILPSQHNEQHNEPTTSQQRPAQRHTKSKEPKSRRAEELRATETEETGGSRGAFRLISSSNLPVETETTEKPESAPQKQPRSVQEVVAFSFTRMGFKTSEVSDWLKQFSFKREAGAIIDGVGGNDCDQGDALSWAFRFIRYNNKKGWHNLSNSWQAAFNGFIEDYNAEPSDVPHNWVPEINTGEEFP